MASIARQAEQRAQPDADHAAPERRREPDPAVQRAGRDAADECTDVAAEPDAGTPPHQFECILGGLGGDACGQAPMSIRELSRRLGRDFKGLHTDVVSLIGAGLIDQEDGKICFSYDRIHVEFDIDAAA